MLLKTNAMDEMYNVIRDIRYWHKHLILHQRGRGNHQRQFLAKCYSIARERLISEGKSVDDDGKLIRYTKQDVEVAKEKWSSLLLARDAITPFVNVSREKAILLAKQLPITDWVETVPYFGVKSLAALVGEVGDFSDYDQYNKVWKRLGLHVLDDNTAARRIKGRNQAAKDAAIKAGYNPERRAEVWAACQSMLMNNVQFRADRDSYKQYLIERHTEEGLLIVRSGEKAPKSGVSGVDYITLKHIDNRAIRRAQKLFIRALWQAWRDAGRGIRPLSDKDRKLLNMPLGARVIQIQLKAAESQRDPLSDDMEMSDD